MQYNKQRAAAREARSQALKQDMQGLREGILKGQELLQKQQVIVEKQVDEDVRNGAHERQQEDETLKAVMIAINEETHQGGGEPAPAVSPALPVVV